MTLPANIRVNTGAPFPVLVKGSGPVSIAKKNGIWTVGVQIANLGAVANGTNFATLKILVWNTTNNIFQQMTLAAAAGALNTPTNIAFANSPYVVQPGDTLIYVDTAGGAIELDLGLAGTRTTALTIKDVTGHAAANNITIKPSGAEKIDNYTNGAPLKINANYGGVRLNPNTASYVIAP